MSEMAQTQDYDQKPLSVGEWLITLIVLALPLIGIIMLFVWGFSSGNVNRRNYCRATLVFALIIVALSLVFLFVFGGMAALMGHQSVQIQ
jgi:phosphoglycerol transferase MdoB-like AlkP superfamily enzyme